MASKSTLEMMQTTLAKMRQIAETASEPKETDKPEVRPLRRWMAEQGLTGRGLAEKAQALGYRTNNGTISRILHVDRPIRATTMKAIAQALGVEICQVTEFVAAIDKRLEAGNVAAKQLPAGES